MQTDDLSFPWLMACVRWLDRSSGLLCIRFPAEQASAFGLEEGRRAQVTIFTLADVYDFRGVIQIANSVPWLAPEPDGSHERFTEVLRDAGLDAGADVRSTITFSEFTL